MPTRFPFHCRLHAVSAALVAAIALIAPCSSLAQQVTSTPAPMRGTDAIRGVWIPTPKHTEFFASKQHIERHLAELAGAGINSVFVVMWNQGRTFYPSPVMKKLTGIDIDERMRGRDPLQEIIDAARPHNIKVFAWFEFGFATDVNGGPGKEILDKNPQWLASTHDGKPLIKNAFRWMNALDPNVQDFMLSLLMEVVERYDVAGIQGDDRLPAMPAEGGYDIGTVARYRAQHEGREPPTSAKDPAWKGWVQWRADKLSRFMQRIHAETKKRKPKMLVAMAPSVFPWSREEYLQDWPSWVENGWVDIVSPQLYRRDLPKYEAVLRAVTQRQLGVADRRRIFPGVLLNLGADYRASEELVTQMVDANRREGIGGEIYFFSEGVRQQKEFFRKLYSR